MMTVKQFTERLKALKPSLQDKEIVIRGGNGLVFSPEVKMILEKDYDLTSDVSKVIITH